MSLFYVIFSDLVLINTAHGKENLALFICFPFNHFTFSIYCLRLFSCVCDQNDHSCPQAIKHHRSFVCSYVCSFLPLCVNVLFFFLMKENKWRLLQKSEWHHETMWHDHSDVTLSVAGKTIKILINCVIYRVSHISTCFAFIIDVKF